jgi:tRNA A37 threonylcarbamoyladenosine dehydratase
LLSVQADAVIDACDQRTAKQAMSVWALASQTLFNTVGAAGGKRMPHKVDVADLAALLRCTATSPQETWKSRILDLRRAADVLQDEQLTEFAKAVEAKVIKGAGR